MCLPSFLAGAQQDAVFAQSASRASVGQKRRVIFGGATALCALLLPALHRPQLRLVWNVSASVPVGLYRIVPEPAQHRGELVALRPSPALARYMASRRYAEAGALLVKPVAAVAGQQVCRTGATVTIDNETVATARTADRMGRPLPVWTGCHRLSAGTVFLLAPAVTASFDGRYFGPVATSAVVGSAIPLWTWQ